MHYTYFTYVGLQLECNARHFKKQLPEDIKERVLQMLTRSHSNTKKTLHAICVITVSKIVSQLQNDWSEQRTVPVVMQASQLAAMWTQPQSAKNRHKYRRSTKEKPGWFDTMNTVNT